MKITLEIPDALAEEVREIAKRENTTLKSLLEADLRHVVEEHQKTTDFVIRDASFRGRGLQPDLREADGETIRRAAYSE